MLSIGVPGSSIFSNDMLRWDVLPDTLHPLMAKAALGKGLGALIGAPARIAAPPEPGEKVVDVALDTVVPSPWQPRTEFAPENLQELVESISQRGIIQPLIVRMVNGQHELIAGERRWRAAGMVGLKQVPVLIREASDMEVLELALIENLQREDLNPIEEARAYARMAREFQLKQEEIAQKVGKSRAAVANAMRLLDLDELIQTWVVQGRLSVGHAKALLGIKDLAEQRHLAERILRDGTTVRGAEALVSAHLQSQTTSGTRPAGRRQTATLAPALQHVQNRLREHLATQVSLHHGEHKGRLEIEYYGSEDLQRILEVIGLPQE